MNSVKYWADRFDAQQKEHPDDSVKALNFSNQKLMNQVHGEVLSCVDTSTLLPGARLLDTGCGTGELLCKLILSDNDPAVHVYHATDISFQMLKRARENVIQAVSNHASNCHFSIMSVDDMGFERGCFDLILASESLQYTDPYAAILSLIGLTKANGQIVISVPNQQSPHIQKAIDKHEGRFTGLDYEIAMNRIAPHVNSFRIKPLIFAENQEDNPYVLTPFERQLSTEHFMHANRFILHLTR